MINFSEIKFDKTFSRIAKGPIIQQRVNKLLTRSLNDIYWLVIYSTLSSIFWLKYINIKIVSTFIIKTQIDIVDLQTQLSVKR